MHCTEYGRISRLSMAHDHDLDLVSILHHFRDIITYFRNLKKSLDLRNSTLSIMSTESEFAATAVLNRRSTAAELRKVEFA